MNPPPTGRTWQEAIALPLGDPRVTAEIHGLKCAVLSHLTRNRINVPSGYCITLQRTTVDELQGSGFLLRIWTALSNNEARLIVRSSALVEDTAVAAFPGRFSSIRDVTTLAHLVAAVKRCERSAISPSVMDYRSSLDLSDKPIGMGVLIQRQIAAVLAGVAFTRASGPFETAGILVEMIEGNAEPLLSGEETGTLYHVSEEGKPRRHRHLAGPQLDSSTLTPVLSMLANACERITGLLGEPQDIEWVWDGERVYIVQARPIASDKSAGGYEIHDEVHVGQPQRHAALVSLPMADSWGFKAAAAQYFGGTGWGAPNAIVLPPRASRSSVAQALKNRSPSPNGTVIRFSFRSDVALPVRFIPPSGDVVEAFFELRTNPDWAGIISDYVYVESSFEAYVASRALLVEHVPGNWEPDNLLSPDVFLWTETGLEAFRSPDRRQSSVEVPSEQLKRTVLHRDVPPLGPSLAAKWSAKLIYHFSKIRSDLAADLPVNVHFVADAADNWYFLNIRPTKELHFDPSDRAVADRFKANRFHVVTGPGDIHHWNGRSQILVNCAIDRASFSRIASVARALRRAGVNEVHCTFGILSHPAILLREFGLRVHPLYLDHERIDVGASPW